ncbi:MAG: hypothetical protein AAF821_19250 [Cyanobacteria bacterium P01_D01_bin.156]
MNRAAVELEQIWRHTPTMSSDFGGSGPPYLLVLVGVAHHFYGFWWELSTKRKFKKIHDGMSNTTGIKKRLL